MAPGGNEPRVRKRRPEQYPVMKNPRAELLSSSGIRTWRLDQCGTDMWIHSYFDGRRSTRPDSTLTQTAHSFLCYPNSPELVAVTLCPPGGNRS